MFIRIIYKFSSYFREHIQDINRFHQFTTSLLGEDASWLERSKMHTATNIFYPF